MFCSQVELYFSIPLFICRAICGRVISSVQLGPVCLCAAHLNSFLCRIYFLFFFCIKICYACHIQKPFSIVQNKYAPKANVYDAENNLTDVTLFVQFVYILCVKHGDRTVHIVPWCARANVCLPVSTVCVLCVSLVKSGPVIFRFLCVHRYCSENVQGSSLVVI